MNAKLGLFEALHALSCHYHALFVAAQRCIQVHLVSFKKFDNRLETRQRVFETDFLDRGFGLIHTNRIRLLPGNRG